MRMKKPSPPYRMKEKPRKVFGERVFRNKLQVVRQHSRARDQQSGETQITRPPRKLNQTKVKLNTDRTECPREPVRRSSLRNRQTVTELHPHEVTQKHPRYTRCQTNRDRHPPTPTNPHKQQQKIGEIELLLDRERPEHAVDRVARLRIEVVQHQQMHHDVVKEKMGEVEFAVGIGDEEKKSEGDYVRRVKPAQTSFPEWTKANVGLDSRCFRLGPLQMNAKTRNDEKQEDADVAIRADELERADGIIEEVVWQGIFALLDSVIEDDA